MGEEWDGGAYMAHGDATRAHIAKQLRSSSECFPRLRLQKDDSQCVRRGWVGCTSNGNTYARSSDPHPGGGMMGGEREIAAAWCVSMFRYA